MRHDLENWVSRAQAFTGAATVSTHSYQKQSADQCISIGRKMGFLFHVTTAAGAGSTHTFDVIQADVTALTTNKEVLASVPIAAATLVAGYEFFVEIPYGSDTRLHLGVQNTSTGGTTTVAFDAYLMPADEFARYKSFPKVIDVEV